MKDISRLSKAVYVGMCIKKGTPTDVRIRREVEDTAYGLMRAINNKEGYYQKRTGSYREGFRLTTSDVDIMGWFPNQKVISDLSLISLHRIQQDTVVLMECDELHVPSGYTRLMAIDRYDVKVRCCCIIVNSEKYVSSSLAQK